MRLMKLLAVIVLVSSLSGCTWLRESWPWRKKDIPVTPPSEVDAAATPSESPRVQPEGPAPQATLTGEEFPTEPAEPVVTEPEPVAMEPTDVEPVEAVVESRPVEAPTAEMHTPPAFATEPTTMPATVPSEPMMPTDEPAATTQESPAAEEAEPVTQPYSALPPAEPMVAPAETDPLPPEPQGESGSLLLLTPGEAESPATKPAMAPIFDEPYALGDTPDEPPAPDLPPLELDGPVMIESLIPGSTPPAAADEALPEPSEPVETAEPEPVVPPAPPVEVAPPPAPAPPPRPIEFGKEEVVAASLLQVNDKFITVDDLLRDTGESLIALPNEIGEDAFRSRAADILQREARDLVIQTLVYDEAADRLTEQHTKLIDEDVAEYQRKITAEAGSPQKLAASLAARGTDLNTLLESERKRLTVHAFLQARFYPAISVTRRMLWDYYQAHRDEFSFDKKVQMQIIAAPYEAFLAEGGQVSEDERRAATLRAERQINEAMLALRSGESFDDVTRRLSRGPKAAAGGVWPLMAAGSLKETAVEEAAFALAQGQISEIVQTGSGYYIVKARRVDPGRVVPFEQAQEQIDKTLRDQQFNELQQDYFARLLQTAQIRQSEAFQQVALERAVREYWRR